MQWLQQHYRFLDLFKPIRHLLVELVQCGYLPVTKKVIHIFGVHNLQDTFSALCDRGVAWSAGINLEPCADLAWIAGRSTFNGEGVLVVGLVVCLITPVQNHNIRRTVRANVVQVHISGQHIDFAYRLGNQVGDFLF